MKKNFILIIATVISLSGFTQHQEINEKPGLWKEKENEADSTSILYAFRKGTFSGHFRYYFMATDNKEGLTDYYANAVGGGIKFETGRFKNFQVGVSGFFVYNIGSSDLSAPDSKTKQMNRYETGLFDIEDPSNKKDIDRLEELYIKYHFSNNHITLGKQLINTPFINLQDGRMRPTEVEGIWTEINSIKKLKLQLGYLYGISPRSTVKWFKVAESIGVYPVGVNDEGIKSAYAGNLESKGIFLASITTQINEQLKLQFWNQYTENIFNSAMLQADYEYSLSKNSKLFAAAQLVRQDAVKDGGNDDPSKAYFEKGAKAITFGTRLGWKNEKWETSLNYNRITAQGRYLMPREWGRDPFFTFLPRERNEGLGDAHAVLGKVNYRIPKARVTTSISFGHYELPDVTDFRFNKYGMPSYNQLNIDARYKFGGILKGLETQLLYVYKGKTGSSYGNDKYVINKVDMSLWNIVFNYQF
ncbi:MAG TPA: OprD family outer membrane porin [Chitinophagaceae bacterium]|nr:OprD family outer membrane porin [Chitinophagaceae bacterium]